MRSLSLVIAAAVVFAAACEDPAANKPRAITSEPSAASAAGPVSGPANAATAVQQLSISPENSKLTFVGSKVTGKHDGGFEQFSGTVELGERPEQSRVSIEVDMASVWTDAEGLTKHLQTSDFFEVSKYPKSTFVSTKIVPDAEKGGNNYLITGDLEMRGVKKSVTFPAAITVTDSEVTVNSEFAVNRKDFNIVYAGKPDDLIRDDVVVKLDLNAPRK